MKVTNTLHVGWKYQTTFRHILHVLIFLRKLALTFHASCLLRDNLHEMSKPIFWETNKKNIKNLSSAEIAPRVLKIKTQTSIRIRIAWSRSSLSAYRINVYSRIYHWTERALIRLACSHITYIIVRVLFPNKQYSISKANRMTVLSQHYN